MRLWILILHVLLEHVYLIEPGQVWIDNVRWCLRNWSLQSPAYTLTWILAGILHIPWTLYTLVWQPAASCWLNLLSSTRPGLLLLFGKICGSVSVTEGTTLPLASSSPSLQEQATISTPWLYATKRFASLKVALWRQTTASVY